MTAAAADDPGGAALKLTVVIPCLNEEANLAAAIDSVARQPGVREVVVVDGGSSDRSVRVARAHGARVVRSPPGRGRQLNAGWRAASARADWCLFLHADSQLPPRFAERLQDALHAAAAARRRQRQHQQERKQQERKQQQPPGVVRWPWQQQPQVQPVQQPSPQHQQRQQQRRPRRSEQPQQQEQPPPPPPLPPPPCWGCCGSIRLSPADVPLWQSRLVEAGVALRTRLLRLPYGDQALFVRRDALQALGGFREWRLLEDVDLVQRLNAASGPPLVVPGAVGTSGRRYARGGFWETLALHQAILVAWRALGADPARLAAWRDDALARRAK